MTTNISLVMLCHHKDIITSFWTVFSTFLFYTCDLFVLQWKSIPLNVPCLFLSSLPPSTMVTTCFFLCIYDCFYFVMSLQFFVIYIAHSFPQFSFRCSVMSLFVTPWTAALQASLSITNSWSPPKPMSIELVMSSNHLILCHPLLLLPSVFPNIRVFSNESALCIRWPKYWSFS